LILSSVTASGASWILGIRCQDIVHRPYCQDIV
jgi:hypothetical protein